ncbi:hypothetical protein JW977_02290 [Candidatus Falkowbacteria bacterium]|nr:hypothetical protein [Candidatus Falkowbacteria bacterium]
MESNSETEGERRQPEMFFVLIDKPYGDGLLTIVAKDREEAQKKLANCRNFAYSNTRIFTKSELKAKMPNLAIYTYTYVNGSRAERTRIVLAQTLEEAREKLHSAVGPKIKILTARTKSIF